MKNPLAKKILFIALTVLDVALVLFTLIVAIIMIATMPDFPTGIDKTTFIGFLQANPNVYFFAMVIPTIVVLIVNILVLVMYVRKTNEKKKVQLNELSEEEKEALRKELMKDLASNQEEKKEE